MLQATTTNRSLTVTGARLISGISPVECRWADMAPGSVSEDPADHGLAVILPGRKGENRYIRQGLRDGGVDKLIATHAPGWIQSDTCRNRPPPSRDPSPFRCDRVVSARTMNGFA